MSDYIAPKLMGRVARVASGCFGFDNNLSIKSGLDLAFDGLQDRGVRFLIRHTDILCLGDAWGNA